MPSHILTIPDDGVYEQHVQLAATAGLRVDANGLVSENPRYKNAAIRPMLTETKRQQHLEVIARGGGGKSIPDPFAWQCEIRQDRPLPVRA